MLSGLEVMHEGMAREQGGWTLHLRSSYTAYVVSLST